VLGKKEQQIQEKAKPGESGEIADGGSGNLKYQIKGTVLFIFGLQMAMAKGPHLFPSRTGQLSPSATMVLPGQSRWGGMGE
jgi:hypothetical protein